MKWCEWKRKLALFLFSQGITLFGSMLVQFAIIWHIARTTTSGSMVSLSTICSFLPQLLISTFAGVWADHYSRKAIILLSDGCIAAITLILVVLLRYGISSIWLFLLISVIRSVGAGIQTPAVNAMIPQLVPKENLMRVNGINSTLGAVISFAAPIAGGAILNEAPLYWVLMIDVFTAIIGISLLTFIQVKRPQTDGKAKRSGHLLELKEGLKYCFGQKWLKRLLTVYMAYTLFVIPAGYLNVLLVARVYLDNYWYLTMNEVAFFAGMTAGGLALSVLGGFKRKTNTLILGFLLFGGSAILMGIHSSFLIYLATVFFTGFSVPLTASSFQAILQERTPSQMQGRVFGIAGAVNSLFIQVGMIVFGPLADIVSIQSLMIFTGIALLLLAFWSRRRMLV